MTTDELRRQKRRARKALDKTDKKRHSQRICETLLNSEHYQNAQHIGIYLALPEEVNLQPFIERAWAVGKMLYLPVVEAKNCPMTFAPYTPATTFVNDAMQIPVPDTDARRDAAALDMVVVPLVVFDASANRVGMGGGFYDRTFAFKKTQNAAKPALIGAAFEVQRSQEKLISAAWDVALDAVISEANTYPKTP